MDKEKAASDIIMQALRLAPFDGWNQQTLGQAALAAGYKKTDAIRVFSGGAPEAAERALHSFDEEMIKALEHYHLDGMKIRERIATIVRVRIELMAPHREGLRKIAALLSLPMYVHRHLRSLYATVDEMWHLAGDRSTDFNFYTKRLMLAGVYSSTVLFWFDDKSAGYEATWAFLARRIENVMAIEKAKKQVKDWLGGNAA